MPQSTPHRLRSSRRLRAESSVGLTLVPNADGAGLLVQDVDPDSLAAEKGFAVGDTILEVDNKDGRDRRGVRGRDRGGQGLRAATPR